MSPVGGVGINYAIQDAIEAANVLATPLRIGQVTQAQLAEIQKRSEPAVKVIQRFQGLVQLVVDLVGVTLIDSHAY